MRLDVSLFIAAALVIFLLVPGKQCFEYAKASAVPMAAMGCVSR